MAAHPLAHVRPFTLSTDEVSRHSVRLIAIGEQPTLHAFSALPSLLHSGDLVIVNDAATLPASLRGHTLDNEELELRLSGPIEANRLRGVLLGAGDHRIKTEDRPAPPRLAVGDRIWLGFDATVIAVSGRSVEIATRLDEDALWQAIYAAGAPVQYAYRTERVPLYAVQTAYASRPWSVEMPSAGRPLTWEILLGLRRAGIELATVTHAAGLSSTGDDAIDRALPLPERYEIPRRTVEAIAAARTRGGRVIAIGTTVVRAVEAAAQHGELVAGSGVATLRLEPGSRLQIVDGLVSGLHSPGESHFELLQAFAPRAQLERALDLAAQHGLSSHELGDACVILRS